MPRCDGMLHSNAMAKRRVEVAAGGRDDAAARAGGFRSDTTPRHLWAPVPNNQHAPPLE